MATASGASPFAARIQWLNWVEAQRCLDKGSLRASDFQVVWRLAFVYFDARRACVVTKPKTMAGDMGVSVGSLVDALNRLEAIDAVTLERDVSGRIVRITPNLDHGLAQPYRLAKGQYDSEGRGNPGLPAAPSGRTNVRPHPGQTPDHTPDKRPTSGRTNVRAHKTLVLDSIDETLIPDSNESRPADAGSALLSDIQRAVDYWNQFRLRKEKAVLHRLSPKHESTLREILRDYGLGIWCAIVDQFEVWVQDVSLLALEQDRCPPPPDLGVCLNRWVQLMEESDRARQLMDEGAAIQ